MTSPTRPSRPGEGVSPGTQLALELGHTPLHGEADFLVGEGNGLALAHLLSYPNWPGPLTLVIGPASSGKSHLAKIWADRTGAVTAGADQLEDLSRQGGTAPLVIEDVDRAGYEEAALFHLLNQSMRDRRPLLMTAREPVSSWPYVTDDVKSRARLAASFTIELTDDIHLSQIFVKLFGDRQVAVDPRIISYLVARMERSPEEATALVDLLDRLALERGTKISRSLASEALALRRVARGEEAGDIEWESDDEDE